MNTSAWLSVLSLARSRVWIYSPDPEIRNNPDAVLLSNGSGPASGIAADPAVYQANAWLPKPAWRRPEQKERDALWSASPPTQSRLVSVLRLFDPEELGPIRQALPALRRLDCTRTEVWQNPTIRLLIRTISKRCRVTAPIACNGLAENIGGLATVTVNPRRNAFVGLHLDSWDKLPIEDLSRARNRISVNIGEEVRYLLFINLAVVDCVALLGGPAEIPETASARDIAISVLASCPDYPIARIAIHPGEAYIAPTENILHDGSSAGATRVSAHVTFRGNFDFSNS